MKKIKATLLVLAILALAFELNSQTFQYRYTGPDYDEFQAVDTLKDTAGYSHYGYTNSYGAGLQDGAIVTTDLCGRMNWGRTYGGLQMEQFFFGEETADQGHIATGYTNTWGNGAEDILLVKTNTLGQITWQYAYGYDSTDYGFHVQELSTGGYVLTGTSWHLGTRFDGLIMNVDAFGNVNWVQHPGGYDADVLYSTKEIPGGYISVGMTRSITTGNADVFVVRLNSLGGVVWARSIGGIRDDWAEDVTVCDSADSVTAFYVVGRTQSYGQGNNDVYVLKLDGNGNVVWSRALGSTSTDEGYAIHCLDQDSIIVNGITRSFGAGGADGFMLTMSKSGNKGWFKTYGSLQDDAFYHFMPTRGPEFINTGYTRSFNSVQRDFYAVKTDRGGQVVCNYLRDSIPCDPGDSLLAWDPDTIYDINRDTVYLTVDTIPYDSNICSTCIPPMKRYGNPVDGKHQNNDLQPAFRVYPNPTDGNLQIELTNDISHIQVVTMDGRIINDISIVDEQESIEIGIQEYPPGVYFVRCRKTSGEFEAKKIIKR